MLLTQEQRQRHNAFWERTNTDRAVINAVHWKGEGSFPAPASLEQQWLDLDYRVQAGLAARDNTEYFLEGFPFGDTAFGPGSLAAVLTGFYKLGAQTIWFEEAPPYITDYEDMPPLVLDTNSDIYRMTDELTDRMLAHADKLVSFITDIGGTYDIMASLRGTDQLLYDLYDHPDEVKALRDRIAPLWAAWFRHLSGKLIAGQGGMTSWLQLWSELPFYPLQCDFSAMISPAMFEEFILPDLKEQTELMPRSIYHLDGPGEIRHLDLLLSLPRLSAIQWVPGSGASTSYDPCWYELFARIQKAGKGLVLNEALPADGVEEFLRHVPQRGLYMTVAVRDAQEAAEIAAMAVRLNRETQRG